MTKGVLLAVFLAVSIAQVIPACGEGGRQTVVGWVEEKYHHLARDEYMVIINHIEYVVPYEFYLTVDVGDLVKSEGGTWTVVRKRGQQSGG